MTKRHKPVSDRALLFDALMASVITVIYAVLVAILIGRLAVSAPPVVTVLALIVAIAGGYAVWLGAAHWRGWT